ncbi:MAG: FeoB-associated Cys-rich membrane protein [Firmicutes bacterium]|nr:FeoB-associated Cys-rich membrane protein [Bacillota bacterium]
MNPATVIAAAALLLAVFLAVRYIVREKKRGAKCIGCPYAGSCQKHGGPQDAARNCGK